MPWFSRRLRNRDFRSPPILQDRILLERGRQPTIDNVWDRDEPHALAVIDEIATWA